MRIAVGTDSLASNTSLSMTAEIKALMEMSGNRVGGGPSLEEVLRWATVSAAEALGIDDTLGSIEPGKRPGLVLLKGVDMDTMMPYIDFSAKRIV